MNDNLNNEVAVTKAAEESLKSEGQTQTSAPLSSTMAKSALPQTEAGEPAVTQQVTGPIKSPNNWEIVNPHPDPGVRVRWAMVREEDSGEYYVISSELMGEYRDEFRPMLLIPYMTMDGSVKIWPIGFPDEPEKDKSWRKTDMNICNKHAGKWVKVGPNYPGGRCKTVVSEPSREPADWSGVDIERLYNEVLAKTGIKSKDHPFLKKLRGED